jgi:arylsulfatase A-like enzyme
MWLQEVSSSFIFDVLPVGATVAALLFYTLAVWKRVAIGRFPPPIRRGLIGATALLMGGVFVAAWQPQRRFATPRLNGPPNILIIASDSLRADHLSCHGYPRATSPQIDALAARSIHFTRMMTPIASTTESMTSLMTSQYPHTHGLRHMYPSREQVEQVLKNSPQLPALLRKHGWRTAVLGDWCAGMFKFLPLGFEDREVSEFDDFRYYLAQMVYRGHYLVPLCFDNEFGHWIFPRLRSFATFGNPKTLTRQLNRRLRQEGAEPQKTPFFITAFYSCTHFPYFCRPPYHALFTDPQYNGRHRFKADFDLEKVVRGHRVAEEFRRLPEEEIGQIRALYDGSLRFFDDQVGEVLACLKENGLSDNTIVIILSDHGEDLFDPNTTVAHGWSFEGGDQTNHVPFILHLPGDKWRPRTVSRITRTIDVAPTLLDLLGLPAEPRFEGQSLSPYVSGEREDLSLAFYGETSLLFFERHTPGGTTLSVPPLEDTLRIDPTFGFHFVVKPEYEQWVVWSKERCLRTERWKLVLTPSIQGDKWRLFDLRADPKCLQDVKEDFASVLRPMQIALRGWKEDQHQQLISEIFPDGEPGG